MMRAAVILYAFLALAPQAFGQGGPPLITDDPNTPAAGRWEIDVAGRWLGGRDVRVVTAPYVDFSYGVTQHTDIEFETGWAFEDESGHAANGLINYVAGTKIRFLDEDTAGISMSVYPEVQFRGPIASKDERINDNGSHLLLPVEVAKTFGSWGVNPEIGVDSHRRRDTSAFYGVAVAYAVEDQRELLAEIRGRSAIHEQDQEWLFNVGTRWRFDENRNLRFSVGHSWQTFRKDDAFLIAYLGTQLRF